MGKGKRNKTMRRGETDPCGQPLKDFYRSRFDAGVRGANISAVPASETVPDSRQSGTDEKRLFKLYSTIATTVWRMKRQILDAETGEPKDGIDGRSVEKLARYLYSLDGALSDVGVEVVDYDNKPRDDGDAVKVVTSEPRKNLKRREYVETYLPTVRLRSNDGNVRILQVAEVCVGVPTGEENNNSAEKE